MELSWTNPLQYLIWRAMERGVPATTLVLVLAFPMAAAIIAASRHLIGLRGFGIFIPAVLAVALVASGIGSGLVLFGAILMMATIGRLVVKRLGLQYLPRMALLLWFVSLGVFGVVAVAPDLGWGKTTAMGIFPVLIMILLTESFMEVQMTKSIRSAVDVTVETMVLALMAAGILSLNLVQRLVLLYPEITVISVAVFDLFMGKYVGLRLKEYVRFKRLVAEK